MTEFRTPSAEELYALEALARRERARVNSALLKAAGRRVRDAFVSLITKPHAQRPKEMRHA